MNADNINNETLIALGRIASCFWGNFEKAMEILKEAYKAHDLRLIARWDTGTICESFITYHVNAAEFRRAHGMRHSLSFLKDSLTDTTLITVTRWVSSAALPSLDYYDNRRDRFDDATLSHYQGTFGRWD